MSGRLSDDDWERIEQFAQTPAYERQPEQLLPEGAEPEEEPAE